MRRLYAGLIAIALALAGVTAALVFSSGPSVPVPVTRPLTPTQAAKTPVLSVHTDLLTPSTGVTLRASNGTWTNNPTSFGYLWEDCNSGGTGCGTAAGSPTNATTYVVVSGDVGHTIRVVVTATNSAGSASQTSAATGVVTAPTGVLLFNGDFETPLSSGTIQPWNSRPQCNNYGAPTTTGHYPGDFYFDTGAGSSISPSGTATFNAASSATVPPLAGSDSGRIVLPTTASGHSLTFCTLNGLITPAPGDQNTDAYYGVGFYMPALSQINSNAFQGMNMWEFHFNAVWGAPIAWQLHTGGLSNTNGSGNSVVLALETGACNASGSASPGCQVRSNGGTAQCNITSAPNIGAVTCLPAEYAMPPGSVQYGAWNELVMRVRWASDTTGQIQTFYKTASSATWNTGANVTGIPTVQWNVATQGATCTTACGYPVKEDLELYGGAQSAPFAVNFDQQLVGTSLASVENAMPTTGTTPVAPANTVLPAVSGTTTQGNVLTVTQGTWTGVPSPSFSYQWQDCNSGGTSCVTAAGNPTTVSTYTLVTGDVGHTIRAVVTGQNSAGSASATSAATAVVGSGATGFIAGVCSPSPCTVVGKTGYHITAIDSSPNSVYGAGFTTEAPNSALSLSGNNVSIERPGNLSSATQVPLVIGTSQPLALHWENAAAKYGFVYAHINSFASGVPYATPTNQWDATGHGMRKGCGSGGGNYCDMVPLIVATIKATECVGSPPCENVNPNEVFIGGNYSGEGVFSQGVMCDTRLNGLIAGVQIVSASTIGWEGTTNPATRATGNKPNCPALIGAGAHCVSDCVASPPRNTAVSIQMVYGDSDGVYKARLLTGGAYPACGSGATPTCWQWSEPDLLSSTSPGLYGAGLGCSASPTVVGGQGLSGKITFSTYGSCTDPGAAVQGVFVTGGGHGIDTTGSTFNALGVCTAGCTQNVNSDGFSDPDAAWAFWTTHFPA